MSDKQVIDLTWAYVQKSLANAKACHDWRHIQRVWTNAKLIAQHEQVDMLVVELAALLHDIADSKFHDGDDELGPKLAADFLISIEVGQRVIEHVQKIIRNMSFRSGLGAVEFHSNELEVVQDADRLDAIGAIGIARAFSYGGLKNREFYNPEVPPMVNITKEAYIKSDAPTINHFYEKLLLLKDKMHTETAKKIAHQRHQFMEQYLHQFYLEWNGEMLEN